MGKRLNLYLDENYDNAYEAMLDEDGVLLVDENGMCKCIHYTWNETEDDWETQDYMVLVPFSSLINMDVMSFRRSK